MGEKYDKKMTKAYAQLNVLYCKNLWPDYYQRDKHEPFEVYRLQNNKYLRYCWACIKFAKKLIWGIEIKVFMKGGNASGWFDERNGFLTPEELAQQESLRTTIEQRD